MKNNNKIPYLTYDAERISDDIPIKEVIAMYTNINPHKKGNINCPSPDHLDKTPSVKVYDNTNTCHCFSCKKTYNSVGLTTDLFPELSFPEVCKKLIDDFGLNVYQYSNLREVEQAKDANAKNKFFDYFPVNETELSAIGIQKQKNEEVMYTVKATLYCEKMFGEIPPFFQTHDKEGQEVLVTCCRGDMIDMGIIIPTEKETKQEMNKLTLMQKYKLREEKTGVKPTKEEQEELTGFIRHEYINKYPSLQELWKDNKKAIEEIIVNKCYERMESINELINDVQKEISSYKLTHNVEQIKEASKYKEAYEKALSENKFVKLSPVQEEKIDSLVNFEDNKDYLRFLNKELDRADEILHKVLEHEKAREKAEFKRGHRNENYNR